MGVWAYIVFMKTTIEIADGILARIKQMAAEEKRTIKELTEEGLLMVIENRRNNKSYKVRPVISFGNGLSAEFKGKSWNDIRDEIYKGYGT